MHAAEIRLGAPAHRYGWPGRNHLRFAAKAPGGSGCRDVGELAAGPAGHGHAGAPSMIRTVSGPRLPASAGLAHYLVNLRRSGCYRWKETSSARGQDGAGAAALSWRMEQEADGSNPAIPARGTGSRHLPSAAAYGFRIASSAVSSLCTGAWQWPGRDIRLTDGSRIVAGDLQHRTAIDGWQKG